MEPPERPQPVHLVDGPVPKHEQLKEILAGLATGLPSGHQLPSERELCDLYGVSRITVRQAVGALVGEGVLARTQGKGTFVSNRPLRSHLHLASFHEDMRRLGLEPATAVLSVRHASPPPRTAGIFGLTARGRAYHVRRLRLADDKPISVDDAWYNAALVPGLDQLDLGGSIYQTLAQRYGRAIDRADQTVGAALSGPEMGVLLGVPETHPVLRFDRVSYSRDEPVEHAVSWYRADRYELSISLDAATPA